MSNSTNFICTEPKTRTHYDNILVQNWARGSISINQHERMGLRMNNKELVNVAPVYNRTTCQINTDSRTHPTYLKDKIHMDDLALKQEEFIIQCLYPKRKVPLKSNDERRLSDLHRRRSQRSKTQESSDSDRSNSTSPLRHHKSYRRRSRSRSRSPTGSQPRDIVRDGKALTSDDEYSGNESDDSNKTPLSKINEPKISRNSATDTSHGQPIQVIHDINLIKFRKKHNPRSNFF